MCGSSDKPDPPPPPPPPAPPPVQAPELSIAPVKKKIESTRNKRREGKKSVRKDLNLNIAGSNSGSGLSVRR